MKETNHGVDIAYDSQITSGHLKKVFKDHKVFTNSGVVFGMAGDCLFNNQVRFLDIPEVAGDPFRWLVKTLVPLIREMRKEVDEDGDGGLEILVALKGQVFRIDNDLLVSRNVESFDAIGSGSSFAMAAMLSGSSAKEALTIASQLDIYTGGPLYVTTAERLLRASALA